MSERRLQHVALVGAVVNGVIDRVREDTLARVVVAEDDGAGVTQAFRRAEDAPLVAIVVGSIAATALVTLVRGTGGPELVQAARTRKDGHARALVWAGSVRGPIARGATPERIAAIVEEARASGLGLVEPDRSIVAPVLGRMRLGATALDRAIATIELLGATAHPLVFVPERRAGKGVPKLRPERLVDGWVGPSLEPGDAHDAIEDAALGVLATRSEPLRIRELLREVRTTIKASTDDAARLCRAVYRASLHGRVELFAAPP